MAYIIYVMRYSIHTIQEVLYMSILLLGGTGRLGSALLNILPNTYAPTRQELDIADTGALISYIADNCPDIIINCAAITDLNRCEMYPSICFDTNTSPIINMTDICNERAIKLIQISTNYVFPSSRDPYVNTTEHCRPISVYGWSKYVAEEYIVRNYYCYSIVRVSNLFGGMSKTPCFADKIIRKAVGGSTLEVTNTLTNPTYVPQIPPVIKKMITDDVPNGILHIVGGLTTYYEFAKYLIRNIDVPIVEVDYESSIYRDRPSAGLVPTIMLDWKAGVDEYLGDI